MNPFAVIGQVCLLILGLWWCKEVLGRFRSDLEVVKTSDDGGHRAVIIFWWGATVVVMLLMALFALNLVVGALPIFSGWG